MSNPFRHDSRVVPIVSFFDNMSKSKPPKNDFPTSLTIYIDPKPGENLNLKNYLTEITEDNRSRYTNFMIKKNDTNARLFGHPSYNLIYTYRVYVPQHLTYKVETNQIGTIIGGDKIFKIRYSAELENFNR